MAENKNSQNRMDKKEKQIKLLTVVGKGIKHIKE